jgi:23S rRNA (uracil1939-C5)-methyltransferase
LLPALRIDACRRQGHDAQVARVRSRQPRRASSSNSEASLTPREGTVERLVPGGAGLLRDDEGVVFVDDVAPGERVRYVERGRRGGARRGRLLTVLQPSPARVTPSCPHAGHCGGCDWLHLDRAAQTRGKEQLVDDSLVRVGRFAADVVPSVRAPLVVPTDVQGAARRRVRWAVNDDGRVGFFARGLHEVVVVDACPALDARLQDRLARLPPLTPRTQVRVVVDDDGHVAAAVHHERDARALLSAGVVDGVIVVGDDDDGRDRLALGRPWVVGEVTAGRWPARSDAASFTQATRAGGRAIVDAVLAAVDDDGARLDGVRVLELFCGSGHLTLPLAGRGALVDAVEGDARAVRWLGENANLVAGGRIQVRRAFIDDALPLGEPAPQIVVADPPRTGIPGAAALFRRLWDKGVRLLVLVSCDPATGARDLRAAVDAGFLLRRVVPLDAFPGTHHVEWVATLQRGATSTTSPA